MEPEDIVEISLREVEAALTEGIAEADLVRAAGIAGLVELRLARDEGLRRERDIRRAVDERDPRVALLDRRLELSAVIGRNLQLETLRAGTTPPEPDPKVWTLHGRVLPSGRSLPRGLRAGLVLEGGKPVPSLDPSRVDSAGVFVLRLPLAAAHDGKDAGTGKRFVTPGLFLQLTDSKGEEIALDPRPLQPVAGGVAYREIALTDADTGGIRPKPGAGPVKRGTTPEKPVPPEPPVIKEPRRSRSRTKEAE